MPLRMEEYNKAYRMAQKEFRACVFRGEYPYLQVLDDILQNYEIDHEQSLGLINIPLDEIVGTKTEGRKTAFARNFMPFLEQGTEFANKWMALCAAQENEGIRDPIQAYEFMNRFYVQEGNKRVSVMKFYGAASIPGVVTRIVPKRTDDPENVIYYEFMDFYALSGVYDVTFTKPGRFAKLQRRLGFDADHVWTADERLLFSSVYYRFEQAFKEKNGDKLPITAGDALLSFLKIFPYDTIQDKTSVVFKRDLSSIWEEVLVLAEPKAMELSLEPKKGSIPLISRLYPATKGTLHVAFLHERDAETSGWTYSHEFGRNQLDRTFGEKIHTTAYTNVVVGENDDETIERAIADGNTVIFTTTPKLIDCSLKAAVAHPEVRILNCSLNMHHPYIRTYYGRIYEAKFLVGVIAGALADDNRVGYIASYPTYGTTADINAFALGAQLVNPRTKVYLEWSASKGQNADESFRSKGISVISSQDSTLPAGSEKVGLYQLKQDGSAQSIAMPFWHWGLFYEKIVKSIFDSTWKNEEPEGGVRAINYWWGMGSGVADILCTRTLPSGTRRLVDLLKADICAGTFNPFSGELYAQGGLVQGSADAPLTPEQILKMDWLAENVVGKIPSYGELIDEAKPMVNLQGVLKEETE